MNAESWGQVTLLGSVAAALARRRPDCAELAVVIAGEVDSDETAVVSIALMSKSVEVVARPEGLTHWGEPWRDAHGITHYGDGTDESLFLRLRPAREPNLGFRGTLLMSDGSTYARTVTHSDVEGGGVAPVKLNSLLA